VLFLDKPDENSPAGIYGVNLETGAPKLVLERIGIYSSDLQYVAYPDGGQTIVEGLKDGQLFLIPSSGRAVGFSTDSRWVAWTFGQSGPPYDTTQRQVWVSKIDGSGAKQVASVYSGGMSGWFPDGRLLISGKLSLSDQQPGFFILSVDGGDPMGIVRTGRLRSASLSPGGNWLAYTAAFSDDPNQDGLWVVNTQTHVQTRLSRFGAFHWRDADHLLVIPLDISLPAHQLWQYDAPSEDLSPLTDPAVTPFKVANNDWSVSPNGEHIAFVSAEDGNIWLLDLP
jgi:Tol biopolymer transport system component